jgi:ArsR family transcriptional regulator, arsenate/arsenite/antimonite-responsive transcriptional repressor / arsenate reductase (thioredoxin)
LSDRHDERARILAAFAEPVRMAMVDRLVYGDASPSELGAQVDLPSNLLAHHLRVLDEAGIVRRVRSEGDRRRSYIQLRTDHPLVLAAIHAGEVDRRLPLPASSRVLFVCTANSARSQLAAAAWNRLNRTPAASAGTHPGPRIHPRTFTTADRHGLRLMAEQPAPVAAELHDHDLIIAVCDSAHEELPADLPRLHWAVPDPVRVDTDAAFEAAFTDIIGRIRHLNAVQEANPEAS